MSFDFFGVKNGITPLLHAFFAGFQAHADGGGKRDLPIGAAVAVGIVVILGPGSGDIGSFLFLRRSQDHGGVGAVPGY